ncbi:DUF2946 domain-containing protein [Pseudomonas sp. 2FE]|uniref:DUF2946 domain-containing protein n=1 Tax=Pseudomonas sp. 2FE TaxID=2502190 RepID=UPI0010F5C1D3|nr:DUF2946 domain-containing protein [Pseudomonas sp. 2FE]
MKLARTDRSLMAWMLYFSVLFNVLACGIGHGQMLGLSLNGVGGAFCSAAGNAGPTLDSGSGAQSGSAWSSTFSCPLCGTLSLGLALLFCLSWLRRAPGNLRPAYEPCSKAPPRYTWPSASPRASPF